MRLIAMRLKGFQCYRDLQTVNFDPAVTLIAGRNDVGKSALFRSLLNIREPQEGRGDDFAMAIDITIPSADFLARLPPVEAIPDGAQPSWRGMTGRLSELSELSMTVTFGYPANAPLQPFDLELHDIDCAVTAFGPEGTTIWTRPPEGVLPGVGSAQVLNAITGLLSQTFMHIAPRRAAYTGLATPISLRAESSMRPDGSNITEVLATLLLGDRARMNHIVSILRDAFPDIHDISVPPLEEGVGSGPRGSITVDYVGGERHPLHQCGTGIEQLLILVTGVLTAKTARIVLIDEPHAYLHPHAERSLVRFMNAYPLHQYIVATHSSAVLRSYPLAQARLIHRTPTGAAVTQLTEAGVLLSELGITPADLWLPDAFLWVEGPSDVDVARIVAELLPSLESRHVFIGPMPHGARFAGREAVAATSFEFMQSVVAAVSPTPAPLVFLFDSDEKTKDDKAKLVRASGDRAQFLEVREIENLLLDAASIAEYLSQRSDTPGKNPISEAAANAALAAAIADTHDSSIYKKGATNPDAARASGAAVLNRVFQELSTTDYEKTRDAGPLSAIVLKRNPGRLAPLVTVLQSLAAAITPVAEWQDSPEATA